jgi:chlorite dismutase
MKDEKTGSTPPVPLTLEGSYILHQMFRIRWPAWKEIDKDSRGDAVEEAASLAAAMEQGKDESSALFSVLGHKGDLLIVHFRRTLEALNSAELSVVNLKLAEFLEPTTSYLSVVEMGLYEATVRLYDGLKQKGIPPGSPEWTQAVDAEVANQKKMAAPRLWPPIPARRYVCFYPMNKLRGEIKNWYSAPIAERQKMMADHGVIGRKYAGQVTQIIGSGAWIFSPTIRWSSRNSFTRCASTRPAPFTGSSAHSTSASDFRRRSSPLFSTVKILR